MDAAFANALIADAASARFAAESRVSSLLAKVAALEEKLQNGGCTSPPQAGGPPGSLPSGLCFRRSRSRRRRAVMQAVQA
jgi:hypothetical protein